MPDNDNAPRTGVTQARFVTALNELIGMCLDGGLDMQKMVGPLKAALLSVRRDLMPSKFDDKYDAERGMPPMTEEEIRRGLELEPYEPIPPQRDP